MFSINFINMFVDYFSKEKEPWYNFVGLIQICNVPEINYKTLQHSFAEDWQNSHWKPV